jgi:uncharacterized protein YggE
MKLLTAVLVLFAAAAIAGVAQPHFARSADTTAAKTITVSGDGSVETVPDRAAFSFTVTSTADTARTALAKNGVAADAVVAALNGAKVQTSGLSLDPRLDARGAAILGYTASTTVTADAELAQAGALIDAAVAAGATGVSGPSFSASDRTALYAQALKEAVADARTKATALAGAAGLTLGGVQSVAEGSASYPQPVCAAPAGAVTTLVPGTETIDATVTVTFAAAG